MRIFIVILIFSLFSCNQKQEKISKEKKSVSNLILNDKKENYSEKKKDFKLSQIYNNADLNLAGIYIYKLRQW